MGQRALLGDLADIPGQLFRRKMVAEKGKPKVQKGWLWATEFIEASGKLNKTHGRMSSRNSTHSRGLAQSKVQLGKRVPA